MRPSGPAAGEAFCFATGPMECELTGTRSSGAGEWQSVHLRDRDGQEFEQLRWVPLASNRPSRVPGRTQVMRDPA